MPIEEQLNKNDYQFCNKKKQKLKLQTALFIINVHSKQRFWYNTLDKMIQKRITIKELAKSGLGVFQHNPAKQ